jgi:hypothetical protein
MRRALVVPCQQKVDKHDVVERLTSPLSSGNASGNADDGPLVSVAQALQLLHTLAARTEDGTGEPSGVHLLSALVMLRQLREELAGWEPRLIAAAREQGISWAQLAPALGVASRQAAERRYLRLRPAEVGDGGATADERIRAERDRRASDRVVTEWARQNSASLRSLAGQISALNDLAAPAQQQVDLVHEALAHDDAARLLPPLADSRSHLQPTHPHLAEQIDAITERTDQLRREATARRRAEPGQRS